VTTYDAIVAGAGPAGSTAARLLAQGGARVLLLDRARFPRDKPCGGGVTIQAANDVDLDLSPVIERTVTEVRVSFRLGSPFARSSARTARTASSRAAWGSPRPGGLPSRWRATSRRTATLPPNGSTRSRSTLAGCPVATAGSSQRATT